MRLFNKEMPVVKKIEINSRYSVMRKVLEHFKKNDPKIYAFFQNNAVTERLKPADSDEYFYRLCREIIFQQLSGKAGDAICSRFAALFPGKKITPRKTLQIPRRFLRQAGLSGQKSEYVKNLAEAFAKRKIRFLDFPEMADEEIIAELTTVKGIGRWTAEMFLMFTMAREDVFSFGDLGLKNGLMRVYGFKEHPDKIQAEKIISCWSPYKTYGCLALWRSADQAD